MNAFDRRRAAARGEAVDEYAAPPVIVDAAPALAAEAPPMNAFERRRAERNGGELSAFDKRRSQSAAPVSDADTAEHVGKFVGRYLADPNNSPSARALDSLGFDATQRQWIKDDPADWLAGDITAEDVAAKAVPAAALAAGLATGGAGPAAALALGVGGGGAARAGAAWLRGQDVSDAVLDPKAFAWDVGLSGIPLALQGAKAGGTALWNAAPSSVREPVANAAGSAARYVGGKASGAVSKAANWLAKDSAGYGEKIIEDRPVTLGDVLDRPDLGMPPALAENYDQTLPITGSAGHTNAKDAWWSGAVRELQASDNPVARLAGQKLGQMNRMYRGAKNFLRPRGADVLSDIAPEESAPIFDALHTGQGINATAPGLPGAPDIASKARPLRDLLDEVNDARTSPDDLKRAVWDRLTAPNAEQRALELLDRFAGSSDPIERRIAKGLGPVGEDGTMSAPWYARAQTTQNFVPLREVADQADNGILSDFQQMRIRNPQLSNAQIEARMGGLSASGATGYSRTGIEEFANPNKNLHEIIPGYLEQESKRIAAAHAFGGEPHKFTFSTGRGGARDFVAGSEAREIYDHLRNTGEDRFAELFLNALADFHVPRAYEDAGAKILAQKASDMALSKAWATNLGQSATSVAMSGGLKQAARAEAMIENNPVLREIFAAGPQNQSLIDYTLLGRGGVGEATTGLPTPMGAMGATETFNRGIASRGAVPMVYDASHEAARIMQAAAAEGRAPTFSRTLIKKAAEMGTTPERLGQELLDNGTLSHGTWIDSIQSLVDRWQHVTGAGELPSAAADPVKALILQYKTFGIKQSQLIKDDIIDPLMEAYRTGDKELRNFALARAARLGFGGGAVNGTVAVAKSALTGRAPTWANIARQSFTGPTGIVGDAAWGVGQAAATRSPFNDPSEQWTGLPAVSVPVKSLFDIAGVAHDPGRAVAGATTLAGAYDPRIPMYLGPIVGHANNLFGK